MPEQTQEKKESEELVTKGYLDEKLESFVTKEYFDEKLEAFATKEYLDERLDVFGADLDVRFDQFEEKMDEKMRAQTAELLQAIDAFVTRVDAVEKDQAGHSALHHGITDEIHEHDKRIKKLEVAMG